VTLISRLRAREARIVDAVAAVVLTAAAQIDTWFGVAPGPKAVVVPCTLIIPATVAWRSRAPLAAVTVAMVAIVVQSLAASPPQALWAIVAVVLLTYSAGAESDRGAAIGALAIAVVGMAINESQAADESAAGYLFVALITILPWAAGRAVHARQRGVNTLIERTETLEREREESARAAVAEERARIARELHDMVAHAVSIMVVKAEAADAVLARRPDQAHDQLQAVMRTGREALAEMTRLLGILRGSDDPVELAPQPGIGRLPELIADVENAGLAVDFATAGAPRAIPPGVDLAAFRIVQEALTNTRKHAGEGATARVKLSYGDRALTIDVEDDGSAVANGYGGGHGLIGMRERVALYGGRLDAGPRASGGFAVKAVLPLEAAQ
jgi:signal transduction histidine kinase